MYGAGRVPNYVLSEKSAEIIFLGINIPQIVVVTNLLLEYQCIEYKKIALRALFKIAQTPLEASWCKQIVGVQEDEVLSPGFTNTHVTAMVGTFWGGCTLEYSDSRIAAERVAYVLE